MKRIEQHTGKRAAAAAWGISRASRAIWEVRGHEQEHKKGHRSWHFGPCFWALVMIRADRSLAKGSGLTITPELSLPYIHLTKPSVPPGRPEG